MKRTPLLDLLVSLFAALIFVAMICSLWMIEFKARALKRNSSALSRHHDRRRCGASIRRMGRLDLARVRRARLSSAGTGTQPRPGYPNRPRLRAPDLRLLASSRRSASSAANQSSPGGQGFRAWWPAASVSGLPGLAIGTKRLRLPWLRPNSAARRLGGFPAKRRDHGRLGFAAWKPMNAQRSASPKASRKPATTSFSACASRRRSLHPRRSVASVARSVAGEVASCRPPGTPSTSHSTSTRRYPRADRVRRCSPPRATLPVRRGSSLQLKSVDGSRAECP